MFGKFKYKLWLVNFEIKLCGLFEYKLWLINFEIIMYS